MYLLSEYVIRVSANCTWEEPHVTHPPADQPVVSILYTEIDVIDVHDLLISILLNGK